MGNIHRVQGWEMSGLETVDKISGRVLEEQQARESSRGVKENTTEGESKHYIV